MQQRKAVHFEIQCENVNGMWAELLQERPQTEEAIRELRDRVRAEHPRERIRAVKVTTTVTVEEVPEERHPDILPENVKVRESHLRDRVCELLQDCD